MDDDTRKKFTAFADRRKALDAATAAAATERQAQADTALERHNRLLDTVIGPALREAATALTADGIAAEAVPTKTETARGYSLQLPKIQTNERRASTLDFRYDSIARCVAMFTAVPSMSGRKPSANPAGQGLSGT